MESIEKDKKEKEDFNFGPCLEKNCSYCCNPVKVERFFPEDEIPVDENGEKIWEERQEILIPENEIDITKVKSYDCKNFNKKTGKCSDYEKRPAICRRASCISKDSKESVDEQHKKATRGKFIVIKT